MRHFALFWAPAAVRRAFARSSTVTERHFTSIATVTIGKLLHVAQETENQQIPIGQAFKVAHLLIDDLFFYTGEAPFANFLLPLSSACATLLLNAYRFVTAECRRVYGFSQQQSVETLFNNVSAYGEVAVETEQDVADADAYKRILEALLLRENMQRWSVALPSIGSGQWAVRSDGTVDSDESLKRKFKALLQHWEVIDASSKEKHASGLTRSLTSLKCPEFCTLLLNIFLLDLKVSPSDIMLRYVLAVGRQKLTHPQTNQLEAATLVALLLGLHAEVLNSSDSEHTLRVFFWIEKKVLAAESRTSLESVAKLLAIMTALREKLPCTHLTKETIMQALIRAKGCLAPALRAEKQLWAIYSTFNTLNHFYNELQNPVQRPPENESTTIRDVHGFPGVRTSSLQHLETLSTPLGGDGLSFCIVPGKFLHLSRLVCGVPDSFEAYVKGRIKTFGLAVVDTEHMAESPMVVQAQAIYNYFCDPLAHCALYLKPFHDPRDSALASLLLKLAVGYAKTRPWKVASTLRKVLCPLVHCAVLTSQEIVCLGSTLVAYDVHYQAVWKALIATFTAQSLFFTTLELFGFLGCLTSHMRQTQQAFAVVQRLRAVNSAECPEEDALTRRILEDFSVLPILKGVVHAPTQSETSLPASEMTCNVGAPTLDVIAIESALQTTLEVYEKHYCAALPQRATQCDNADYCNEALLHIANQLKERLSHFRGQEGGGPAPFKSAKGWQAARALTVCVRSVEALTESLGHTDSAMASLIAARHTVRLLKALSLAFERQEADTGCKGHKNPEKGRQEV